VSAAPLVVFVFDAGDPDLMTRWIGDGTLPNLAELTRAGFHGRTTGPELVNEHGALVSLFSGVSCAEHGYYYSRQLRPGTYDLHPTTSRDARAEPFWARLAGSGRRVAILDVPDTVPVRGLPGIQLCDWATHNPRWPAEAEPPALFAEVRRIFGRRMTIPEEPDTSAARDRRILDRMLERIRRKGALFRELLGRDAFDVVVAAFGETHTGAHQFWPYHTRQVDGGLRLEGAIRRIYAETDREMGALRGLLPARANVLVVTSVGIQEQYPVFHLMEDFCRKLGWQAAPGGRGGSMGASRGEGNAAARGLSRPMDVIRRVVPESLRVGVSRHFPRATRERLLAEQWRSRTDWTRTRVFAIPSSFTGLLRVNLRGREPRGTVEPGTEYRDVLEAVVADLRGLVDPFTNEPAVADAIVTADRFGGGPPEVLPDVFVHFRPARHFLSRVIHPRAELVQRKPEFCRDTHHSQVGFVAGAGPDLPAAGDAGDVAVRDLAPTFLSLAGAPPPAGLRGSPLRTASAAGAAPRAEGPAAYDVQRPA
jgi:predicted AlkP superfamily phosphohydrolase/phosphomutase